MPSFDEELQAALAGDGGKGGSFDDELKGALSDPSVGGRVPPEQQQPSDPSLRVVDNPQATVRAGIPEQGPPPSQNQQVEPQSKDWLTGAITALANGYRALGGKFASDGASYLPSAEQQAAYGQRMQTMVDNPGQTAAREVASLAAPVVGGVAGTAPQIAAGALEAYADTGDLKKAAFGGSMSGAVSKVGQIVGMVQPEVVTKGISALARAYNESGLKNRLAAAGLDFDDLVKLKGEAGALQVAKDIEEQGLHQGRGPLGWAPQPASTYAKNAGTALNEGQAGMEQAEKGLAALPNPPRVNLDPIQQKLRESAGKNARMIDPAGAQDAAFRGEMADRMQEYGSDSWQKALADRRYLDSNIDWSKGYEGAGLQQQARRDVANPLRHEISASLDRGMANNVDPSATQFAPSVPRELGEGWQNARDRFAIGAQVQPAAAALAAQQQGSGLLSPSGLSSMGAAAAGLYSGHPVAGLAAAGAAQMARNRGASALAGGLEAAGSMTQGFGNAVQGAGNGLQWLSQNAGMDVGASSAAAQPDIAQSLLNRGQRQPQAQTSGGSQGMDNSRGDITAAQVESILRDPQRAKSLQPWATELAANNAGEDDSAFAANIEKLQRKNQQFRERIKMLLGQNVGGQ